MSKLFWKLREPPDTTEIKEPDRPVDEQHALPVGIYLKPEGSQEAEEVGSGNPLPMSVADPILVKNQLYRVLMEVPGIGAAAAYATGDAMGTVFTLRVPSRGTIREVFFHDLDDEGLNKELWLFSGPITAAADNAAFSIADADNLITVAVFLFDAWRDAVNNQVGMTANTPVDYEAPTGLLHCQVKTLGADNIAAGAMPFISMVIEPREAV